MRQLSHNPNAMSRRRGWLLFDVCSGVVAPRGGATTAAVLEFVRRSPWRSSAPHTLHRLRQLSARVAAAGADRLQARKHARTLGPSQPECDAARNNALVPVDVYLAGERAVRVFVEPYATADEVRSATLAAARLRGVSADWQLCQVERPAAIGGASKNAAPDDTCAVRHVDTQAPIGDVLRRMQQAAAEHVKQAIGAALKSHASVSATDDAAAAVGGGGGAPAVCLSLMRRVYYALSERRRMLPVSHSELRFELFQVTDHVTPKSARASPFGELATLPSSAEQIEVIVTFRWGLLFSCSLIPSSGRARLHVGRLPTLRQMIFFKSFQSCMWIDYMCLQAITRRIGSHGIFVCALVFSCERHDRFGLFDTSILHNC